MQIKAQEGVQFLRESGLAKKRVGLVAEGTVHHKRIQKHSLIGIVKDSD